jgi:septal ring factor EnvC (AmiA/AmiB activator)
MKYLYISLFLFACTSKADTLKSDYYQKEALRDSLKKEYNKMESQLIQTDYKDSALNAQSIKLGAQIRRLDDTLSRLKEHIEIEN